VIPLHGYEQDNVCRIAVFCRTFGHYAVDQGDYYTIDILVGEEKKRGMVL
jgi:hypothetical protein